MNKVWRKIVTSHFVVHNASLNIKLFAGLKEVRFRCFDEQYTDIGNGDDLHLTKEVGSTDAHPCSDWASCVFFGVRLVHSLVQTTHSAKPDEVYASTFLPWSFNQTSTFYHHTTEGKFVSSCITSTMTNVLVTFGIDQISCDFVFPFVMTMQKSLPIPRTDLHNAAKVFLCTITYK